MFKCKCCGECCRGGMKVFLNPDDLVRMAGFLKYKNTKKLFENHFVVIDHQRDGRPLPRIRFGKGAASCCPFLVNRLDDDNSLKGICSLHPYAKPLVCSLAPLYRSIDLSSNSETWGFKHPLPGCPGGSETEPQIKPPENLENLLDREKIFFRNFSKKINAGNEEATLIKEFFYINL